MFAVGNYPNIYFEIKVFKTAKFSPQILKASDTTVSVLQKHSKTLNTTQF